MKDNLRVLFSGGDCGGGNCPTVFETADGAIVVQGYKLTSDLATKIRVPNNEDAVVLPRSFFDQMLKSFNK